MSSTVTCQDVARVAGVSPGTVSRVLSRKANVNAEIQERVLRAVQETGYIHNSRRRVSAENKTPPAEPKRLEVKKTFLFCVPADGKPGSNDEYYYQVLRGAEAECTARNINLHYHKLDDSRPALDKIEEDIRAGLTGGIVMVNPTSQQQIRQLAHLNVPLVLIDPYYGKEEVDLVSSDAREGALLAVQHLVELGHRDIALINGPNKYTMERRKDGYRAALEEAGIPYRPELILRAEMTVTAGEEAANALLASGQKFSAIFCSTDNIAFGAIRALYNAGRRVPDDVSIIGFNDVQAAAILSPALTSVNANLEGKGQVAIQRLLSRLTYPDQPVLHSILPVKLMVRNSTAAVN